MVKIEKESAYKKLNGTMSGEEFRQWRDKTSSCAYAVNPASPGTNRLLPGKEMVLPESPKGVCSRPEPPSMQAGADPPGTSPPVRTGTRGSGDQSAQL